MCGIEGLRNALYGYNCQPHFWAVSELNELWTWLEGLVQYNTITKEVRMLSRFMPFDYQLIQNLDEVKKKRHNICKAYNKEHPEYLLQEPK
jgi:hypothetical protein